MIRNKSNSFFFLNHVWKDKQRKTIDKVFQPFFHSKRVEENKYKLHFLSKDIDWKYTG
jgi:hypothetical protein